MSRTLSLLALVGVFLAPLGCKSGEEKFCAKMDDFPKDKAGCHTEYRSATADQRSCIDKCTSDTKGYAFQSCSDGCFGRARGEECSGINGPSASTSTTGPATSGSVGR